jgi:hypothetical protein
MLNTYQTFLSVKLESIVLLLTRCYHVLSVDLNSMCVKSKSNKY